MLAADLIEMVPMGGSVAPPPVQIERTIPSSGVWTLRYDQANKQGVAVCQHQFEVVGIPLEYDHHAELSEESIRQLLQSFADQMSSAITQACSEH